MRFQTVLGKVCFILAASDVITAAALPQGAGPTKGTELAVKPNTSSTTKGKASPTPKAKTTPTPKAKTTPTPKAKTTPTPKTKTSPSPKVKVSPSSKAKVVPTTKVKATPTPKGKTTPTSKTKATPTLGAEVSPLSNSSPVAAPSKVTSIIVTESKPAPTPSGDATTEGVNPFVPVVLIEPEVNPTTPEDGSKDGPDNLRVRLVVPAPVTDDRPALVNRTITLNGKEWYLTEMFRTPDNANTFPNYTAISYRWYDGRLDNPFFDGFLMSNLTLPSLESGMRNSPQEAFWIDCFSIPAEKPLKGIVLDLLSNIFDAAHEVIVPLGLNDADTLPLIAGSTGLLSAPADQINKALNDINQEEWVKSIWTYKEVLSAKNYIFTDRNAKKTDTAEAHITDLAFFEWLSEAIIAYQTNNGLTSWDIRKNLTQVDALEDLGLARELKAPYEGSVVEALANLDRRYVESDKNFFWGFYGVLTLEMIPNSKPHDTIEELYERLFELCESKNDYSFVYTSAERQTADAKKFYPKAGPIHSILTVAGDANYQTATKSAKGITLDGMVTLKETTKLGQRGKEFIQEWFETDVPVIADDGSDASIAKKVLQIIQMVDYTGSEEYILTDDGIFFPQTPAGKNATVLVASQLGWSFGSPGLAKTADGLYIPGAFVGHVAEDIAAPVLMD